MALRFTPSPVPQDDNAPLRVYLDQEFRRVAGSQEDEDLQGLALLSGPADQIFPTSGGVQIISGYAESAVLPPNAMAADPLLGTITLPDRDGIVEVQAWVHIDQTTGAKDFNVWLMLGVGAAWTLIDVGYIPQQSNDLQLVLGASFTRLADAGTVLSLGLQLEGQGSATFNVTNTSFYVRYLTVRG